ncbi:MAG: YlzJ-like family protein [Caldicoprobacterales bacterium]|jgi:hypothetical protein|nr:ribonuclease [Clostridiales bacterium]
MILHTIVDHELIWKEEADTIELMEVTYKGIQLEVKRIEERKVVVNRIISTDPNHYLDPELQPGSTIIYTLQPQSP